MFDFTKTFAAKKGLVAALRKANVDLETVTIAQDGAFTGRWVATLNVVEAPAAPVVTFDLTDNEFHAAAILVRECFQGMGGSRPSALERDEYTWVSADTLVRMGWSKESAAGTFSTLDAKGVIYEYDKNEMVMTRDAWKWLDTKWDDNANALSVREKVTVETVAAPTPVAPVKKGKAETVRQNGVRFPRVGGLCWKAWQMFDELGATVDVKTALAEGAKRGFNDNNIRTELCCWRKFHGYQVVRTTKG